MRNITTFDFTSLGKYNKIYCLVSGGIDSTYLAEYISSLYPNKTYFVNCWNPYEQSQTLKHFKQSKMYIEIRPQKEIDYKQILDESFRKIPQAIELKKQHRYSKKVFPCCKFIKHNAFKRHPMFKEENTVVISGIKYADGRQRQLWLKSLVNGKEYSKGTHILNFPTFYHKHKEGQLYCYPFRDFPDRELPIDIIDKLRVKYPNLKHSGCVICPVLVLFQNRIKNEPRVDISVRYYNKIIGQKTIK